MILLAAKKIPEISMSVDRGDLDDLARALEDGAGSVEAEVLADPVPYDLSLRVLSVIEDRGMLRFEVDWGEGSMSVRGDRNVLNVFLDNVRGIRTDASSGSHFHYDYYEGHDYIDERSVPLVIEFSVP